MSPIENLASSLASQFSQPLAQSARDLERIRTAMRIGGGTSENPQPSSTASSFGKVLEKFVNDVDDKMKAARAERTKILTGESTNLHQAMIASQEANVAFTLMLELRNKLVESYQELMRSQV